MQAILAHKKRGTGFSYVVQWAGWQECTWEPKGNLKKVAVWQEYAARYGTLTCEPLKSPSMPCNETIGCICPSAGELCKMAFTKKALSDYEASRARQVADNQAKLASLGLADKGGKPTRLPPPPSPLTPRPHL